MRSLLSFFLVFLSLFSLSAFSKVKITDVDFQKEGKHGIVTVEFDRSPSEKPELMVRDDIIQVAIDQSIVWPQIEKKISLLNNHDTTLKAYQYNKSKTRVRAIFPYKIADEKESIHVFERDRKVSFKFPLKNMPTSVAGQNDSSQSENQRNDSDIYDESFLEKLLSDKDVSDMDKNKGSSESAKGTVAKPNKPNSKNFQASNQDSVQVKKSATQKKQASSTDGGFNISSYILKFLAFLGLILVGFYGIVHLMKKGVLKKGKLGFLNSTKAVEVLNTTYVAPKRNLMLIKAHNQVFLVGNSEKGMHFLSELNDVTGLMKEGEKDLAGNNFDSSLGQAGESQKEFRLKDAYNQKMNQNQKKEDESSLQEFLGSENENEIKRQSPKSPRDEVKFSDQIKNKVKNLKSLQ